MKTHGNLVLSRKTGESIYIGSDIKITLVSIKGKVRIGISAPMDVEILREELVPPDMLKELREKFPKFF